MKTRFENKWDLMKTNFVFLPLVMSVASVAVFHLLLKLDSKVSATGGPLITWLQAGGADGVRSLLTALVGSLMTALSIVFSITVVALTLAATQLGPRLLRNFMRSRSNQVILGVFISTFLYCLLALRVVGKTQNNAELPHITILGGFVLAVVSFLILIYFIHHVAKSIQANNIIYVVSRELDMAIDRTFPPVEKDDREEEEEISCDSLPATSKIVTAEWDGYLQAIDIAGLMCIAREHQIVLQILRRPGDFVARGETLLRIYQSSDMEEHLNIVIGAIRRSVGWSSIGSEFGPREAAHLAAIREPVILGRQRTATQDIEFIMLQLVEIATRALSPGINDPFTAMICIDRLSGSMCRLLPKRLTQRYQYDSDGALRVILDQTNFAGICNTAFRQIRQYGRSNAAILIRLMEAFHRILKQSRNDEQRVSLWHHACLVRDAGEKLPDASDKECVTASFTAFKKTLESLTNNLEQFKP